MSLSQPLETDDPQPPVRTRFRFNWLEHIALPVASSIMDAQPIALVLLFLSSAFAGKVQTWPLSEWSIPLFMLGLQWWSMLVNSLARYNMSTFWLQSLHALGLLVAFAIFFLSYPAIQGNIVGLALGAALLTWFWRRGRDRTGLHMSDERLIRSFQVGIVITLIVLLFTFLNLLTDQYSSHTDRC